jgi:hypothetical protein
MAYTRIYENIYSFPVVVPANYVAGSKRFFDPCPELKNKRVVGISLSYNNFPAGSTGAIYITLKDNKQNILLQNYPAPDLDDSSGGNNYRLRLFNYSDIDLNNSYWIMQGASILGQSTIFNFNFYLQ